MLIRKLSFLVSASALLMPINCSKRSEVVVKTGEWVVVVEDVELGAQTQGEVESSLKFAHAPTLCVQVDPTGSLALQTCVDAEDYQKFKPDLASDNRIQFANEKARLCLSASELQAPLLVAEPCAIKDNQYFTKQVAGNMFSLRQSTGTSCLKAQNDGAVPGTSLVMATCTDERSHQLIP
ncbi:MAG TPA: ricin-type beta-trefoil lectin domain protein [Oligoflexus sp.]|uniref:ricin-type beta-trefoil lectin domain protein n=1 Tax=Oligoflexus sp. TaxID=1971216 RepID=UPI002D73C26A|nr:ricin-type beta-trefoil lectin domain protein [Oligoflexus sp.]HYX39684.1 ricin-type beta-trefoil lectin domain protein [Oligoflexus sp.]